jgi:membrane protease YdiL (CAAX protease family)
VEGYPSAETTRPPDPLARYRVLQGSSIVLVGVGLVALAATLAVDAALLSGGGLPADREQLRRVLLVSIAGALAVVVGLAMNAVRAVVVRGALPPERYRGPSVIVLVAIASVMTVIGSVSLGSEVAALLGDGRSSVVGSLLVLTITQIGLLVTGAAFVAVPRALAGLRLIPRRGVVRSTVLGIVLAVPAWLGAQLLGIIVIRLLGGIGIEPEVGLADAALERADPVVLVAALVAVAPVAEEVFFRGIVFNAWEREYGTRRAVVGSALLFAAIHGSVFALVPIFGLGLALAILYRETRSLAATIALHAAFNGISVLLALLIRFDVISLPFPT